MSGNVVVDDVDEVDVLWVVVAVAIVGVSKTLLKSAFCGGFAGSAGSDANAAETRSNSIKNIPAKTKSINKTVYAIIKIEPLRFSILIP